MARMEDDDHHLASLDIEENEGETSSSLMHSGDNASDGHSRMSQPQHSPYSPTPPSSTSPRRKATNTNLPLLSACYLSALTTGATTYAFSFYSNALKTSLHLSQNQLDTLSSATFCAGILSWMPGMAVDSWGARSAMALGGTSNTIMLSMYWMIATERWKLPNLDLLIVALSALGVFIFMGCALVTGSVFKVIVESCGSGTKGKAVGCAKGYVGVGSGVYVCLFGALFGSSGGGSVGVGPAARLLRSFVGSSTATVDSATSASSSFSATMNMAAMLPSSSWTSLSNNIPSLEALQNPELQSLNFLLMAAAFSFLAATLPALFLLPKQTSASSPYNNRRDGTRSIHFRVIYAGLLMLGMWVVGVSLAELHEEEKAKSQSPASGNDATDGGATDLTPGMLNKTSLLMDDYATISFEHGVFTDHIYDHDTSTSYTRKLLNVTSSMLASSSPERHWGSVFFLLLLWWGPALSLLVIPPRKECSDDSIRYSPENGNDDGNGNGGPAFNYEEDDDDNDGMDNVSDAESDEEEITFLQDDLPTNMNHVSISAKNDESRHSEPAERNFTLVQMLKTTPAWLMAWTCVILVGGGTVMTNNIGQMTESLGLSQDLTPASLALFSAAQGASRVMTGIASELALKWKVPLFCGCSGGHGVPRPAFLVLASLVSVAAHFILAIATTEEGFAFGVTLSGVAFGMVWPMMVLITGEVFGTRHVGANYMFFDGFSSAAGTLLLSKFVAQEVYDEHIAESHGDPGMVPSAADDANFKCFGTDCFRMSHVVVSVLSLTCIVSSIALIRATRDVYQRS